MPPLDRPAEIRAILETDRPWSVYALGDLSPGLFPHCRWFAAPGPALAMLYGAFTPPVLLTIGRPDDLRPLLDEIAVEPEVYLHVRTEHLPVLRERFGVQGEAHMWRMQLRSAERLPADAEGVVPLTSADVPALRALYADGEAAGEAPGFFAPSMVEAGVYFGAVEGGELVAAAGTHLVAPVEGVAAIGNVYTRRDRRGRGLGRRTTAAVAAELVRRGVPTVVLNVNQGNAAAIRVYEGLGFERYCPFVEGVAVRRGR